MTELNTPSPCEAVCCLLNGLLEVNKELMTHIGWSLVNSMIRNLL
jgi:hypothetical protein